jgi:hypothetical protein
MSPKPEDELASLRAVKLPRARELILKSHDQQRLRSVLLALFRERSSKLQIKHLLVYLQLDVDLQTESTNKHDSVEAVFEDLRDTSLLEHREAALNAIEPQEFNRLCSYAISRCPVSGLRACLLQQLCKIEANANEAQNCSSAIENPSQTLTSVEDSPDSKRSLDFLEWDNDEPEEVHDSCTTSQTSKTAPNATCHEPKRRKVGHAPKETRNSSQVIRQDLSSQQNEGSTAAPPGETHGQRRRAAPRRVAAHMWSTSTIEKTFLAPSPNNTTCVQKARSMPLGVRDQLLVAFYATYCGRSAFTKERTSDTFTCWSHRAHFADKDICLNTFLDSSTDTPECTFGGADGDHSRACDYCVVTHRLCVRMIKHRSTHKLCFFPLPEVFIRGVQWDEVSFWVRSR